MYRVIILDNKGTYPTTLAETIEHRSFSKLEDAINFYVNELLKYKVKESYFSSANGTKATSIDCELIDISKGYEYVLDHRVFYIPCE